MSKQLKDFSIEELETEIKNRKINKPKLLMERHRNVLSLEKIGEEYLNKIIENKGMIDSDTEHHIFERALEYLYGTNIWEFVNEPIK